VASSHAGVEMKKISLITLAALGMFSMNAFADRDTYNGFTLAYVQSSQNGVSDSTSAVAILRSVRLTERYGYEMQFGLFGNIGSYSTNGFVDLSAIGLLPLSEGGFNLYGKAGLADVYSSGSSGKANNFGLTYGAGVEFKRDIGKVRLGFQRVDVGNGTLSPTHRTFLFGLTLFLQ
jgi:opacity protein-like surface antigen